MKTDSGRRDVALAPAVVLSCASTAGLALQGGRPSGLSARRAGDWGDYRYAGPPGAESILAPPARHVFASLLIAKGLNVVFVSCQLEHSSPTITLDVDAHLFEQADHAAAAREALEASYAAMMRTIG